MTRLDELQTEYQENPTDELRQEIKQELSKEFEAFDPETAKQTHIWVDRGAKLSCEGAGHPHHQSWKRR